jgi:inhibitor of KinA sporulation pathway (predicted exonuclease)
VARRHDVVIVVDLESTCWEGSPPEGEVSDVIEVGVCLLDLAQLERRDKRGILVRPERSRVSAFCTELTTLTPEQVGAGASLKEACRVLERELEGRQRAWASYGDYDRRQLERCCEALGVRYPFGPTHLNVKSLFAQAVGLPREVGLAEALDLLGLPLEGTHHRGVDDAWNIAAVLARILAAARGQATLPRR